MDQPEEYPLADLLAKGLYEEWLGPDGTRWPVALLPALRPELMGEVVAVAHVRVEPPGKPVEERLLLFGGGQPGRRPVLLGRLIAVRE